VGSLKSGKQADPIRVDLTELNLSLVLERRCACLVPGPTVVRDLQARAEWVHC
jgi:hypothetical protein